MRHILRRMPQVVCMPRWTVAHAYTPNEQATYGGSNHVLLMEAFVSGRLKREAGDALCKPQKHFWGLHEVGASVIPLPDCKTCLRLAGSHGIDLEAHPRVQTFRERQRAALVDARTSLLRLLEAMVEAPADVRERAQVRCMAYGTGPTCSFGGAEELRGMIDPLVYQRTRYRSCGQPAVAVERRYGQRGGGFPRCIDHLDRSGGDPLGVILAALPPETKLRSIFLGRTTAEVLLHDLDDAERTQPVWEDRGRGEWTYSSVEGGFLLEILG